MTLQPTLTTQRLILRPFHPTDSATVARLAGDKSIADMTANIPHPYEEPMAQIWIKSHVGVYQKRSGVIYAITLRQNDALIGAVSLLNISKGVGTLGYWLGVDYWGNGFAQEASMALIQFARPHFELSGLKAMHLVENRQSQSVIQKLGMTYIDNHIIKMQGKEREVCVYQQMFSPQVTVATSQN
ncbi:GNAT family N-acetyltransferase [Vibrio diabolicus]|uniref:GNAT family N-acetyltransferase n=1 Tax=Vibrio diabolicus TaxID=50719 RepID=UPI003752F9C9